MNEHISGENINDFRNSFLIEAAINEEGPKVLRVVPGDTEHLVYQEDTILCKLKKNENGEWKETEGKLSPGAVMEIARALTNYYR